MHTQEKFVSRFEDNFEIVDSCFTSDAGAFGTIFKVRPKIVETTKLKNPLLEVLARINPQFDFVSEITTAVKVVACK